MRASPNDFSVHFADELQPGDFVKIVRPARVGKMLTAVVVRVQGNEKWLLTLDGTLADGDFLFTAVPISGSIRNCLKIPAKNVELEVDDSMQSGAPSDMPGSLEIGGDGPRLLVHQHGFDSLLHQRYLRLTDWTIVGDTDSLTARVRLGAWKLVYGDPPVVLVSFPPQA
jgi:hypothetical protein